MTGVNTKSSLLHTLENALSLLEAFQPDTTRPIGDPEPLPSLLSQCEALIRAAQVPSIRTVHHFAATGGSVISKCISAQPNVVLLSEIDPLSLISMSKGKPAFSPRSVIDQLRYSIRGNQEDLIVEVFQSEIRALSESLARRGQVLVLRDHAHSQYCYGPVATNRPSLHSMLTAVFPVRSIVTVRHPIDSFLSIMQRDWVNFAPNTLDEYARRYEQFLDDHASLPVFRYEDFTAKTIQTMAAVCQTLDLPFEEGALDLHEMFLVSGDSGRSGSKIELRPRRPVPAAVREQADGATYISLCKRLNYDPVLV